VSSYRAGLIGSGIGPSLTPALHEREAAEHGLSCEYVRFDLDVLRRSATDVGDLVRCARDEGFAGVNVTHPCKRFVVEFLDDMSPEAEVLGAVNTVVFEGSRMVGHNTDTTGFAASLRRFLPDADLGHVVLLGAGGAGSAVADALRRSGAGRLSIVDVDPSRAEFTPGDLPDLLASATGVVHATPVGMAAHPGVPFDVDLLRPELWVAEVVYRPLETELVRAARERGCRVLTGGGMAVFQAVDAFRLFTRREPDADRMLAHFATLT